MNWLQMIAMMGAPAGGEGAEPQSGMFMFIWLGLMIALFYFMLIRPTKRREKQRQALLAAIKTGDHVLFGGGMLGVVSNVKEKTVVVKIAEGVKVEVVRGAISQILEKGDSPEATA
ncbi:MAG: preprotein translocase subunit YajC [Verrucomicrobiota bacterium]|jgi:preprotein translocase subunit YajC|nr:preprotein translocase subunit YajC [Verrucomicrobiota bacterium]